jgi:cobalt/nickel transport system permease protein
MQLFGSVIMVKKALWERPLRSIFGFLQEALVMESFSKRYGFLQSLDPRAKLISFLMIIFASSLLADQLICTP